MDLSGIENKHKIFKVEFYGFLSIEALYRNQTCNSNRKVHDVTFLSNEKPNSTNSQLVTNVI